MLIGRVRPELFFLHLLPLLRSSQEQFVTNSHCLFVKSCTRDQKLKACIPWMSISSLGLAPVSSQASNGQPL